MRNFLTFLFCCIWPIIASGGWIEERLDRGTGKLTTIIHIRVHDWIYPDPSHTATAIRSEAAKVRKFEEQFPLIFAAKYRQRYEQNPEKFGKYDWSNVTVEVHPFSGIKVEGVESDLLAIAGGVAPDVMYINFRRSDTYIQQGFLYPLDNPDDEYFTAMTSEEINFRVPEKIWPVIKRRGPDNQEHVWALPFGGSVGKVLFFRKDLFDEAGLEYPTIDWTWADLHAACRILTDPVRGIYGIRFVRGMHEAYHWTTFLWSAGADILAYDHQNDRWQVAFNNREAAQALDFYTKLSTEPWLDKKGRVQRGYAYKDPADSHIKWSRGEIAMKIDYVFQMLYSSINPDVTGMVPVPLGPTGIRAAELNSKMMGLFAGIKHPAVRDTAWEFIRFFDSEEALAVKTRVMVEGGLGRFINPDYLERFGYPELVRLSPRGWKETFKIALETSKPEPYGKHSNIAYSLLTKPIQQAEQLAMANKLPEDEENRLKLLQSLLAETAERVRREMLGEFPREILGRRRATAAIFLTVMIIVFTIILRRVGRLFAPPSIVGKNTTWNIRRYIWPYLLLLPAVLTILFWRYVPLIRGSIVAFQDYHLMGGSRWVWLDNIGTVLWSRDWWQAVWNAWRYSLLVVSLTFLPPVVLAILLQEVPRGRLLFRTIFYLPAVITGLVVILLWKSFYEPGENGVLNAVLLRIPAGGFLAVGILLFLIAGAFAKRLLYHNKHLPALLFGLAAVILLWNCVSLAKPILVQSTLPLWRRLLATYPEPIRWLDDPQTALTACILPMIWAGMGPGCLIYLAALKGIADDFYEAADIDGATFIDKILFIVFPILKPLLIINFVGVFIGSWFNATANILVMTGGAAGTEVAGLHIFYRAFVFLQFGPATAMAWVLAFMLIGFTIYQLRILSTLEFKTTGDT